MSRYSEDFKAEVVRKMMPPNARTVAQVHRETGIFEPTLYAWRNHEFVSWYNEEHRHSAIRYVTPGQRYRGGDVAILDERQRVYEAAKQAHPERWSGNTRDWTPIGEVWLNPPNGLLRG